MKTHSVFRDGTHFHGENEFVCSLPCPRGRTVPGQSPHGSHKAKEAPDPCWGHGAWGRGVGEVVQSTKRRELGWGGRLAKVPTVGREQESGPGTPRGAGTA